MDEPRIGLFGGSFNPPHLGHLIIASEICSFLSLEKVVFMPAALPPHKAIAAGVSAEQRIEMTRLAIAGDVRFEVSDLEVERGLSYTLDTVAEFRALHAGYRIYFIIGSDSLLQFGSWHQPGAILMLCRLAVAPRPGDDPVLISDESQRWGRQMVSVLPTTPIGISSSEIRGRVFSGLPATYFVLPAVESYIVENGLYRPS